MRSFCGLIAIGVLLPFLVMCKPSTNKETLAPVFTKTTPADPMVQFYASGQTEIRAKSNFYYALFKRDYDLKFDAAKNTGEAAAERLPYVGSWYPQNRGGTNVRMRGNSPLEKYDAVFNKSSTAKATDWERKNHTVGASDDSAAWAGHCNGFSAASSRHQEPSKQVVRGDVTFYPEDIKALLAEVYMGAKFYFLGGNRCGLVNDAPLTPPGSRQDPLTMGACDDVNPGTFHVAVTNWIGIQKYPLIMDESSKEQVWNYPHWKYSFDSRTVSRADANRIITGSSTDEYKFNPNAKQFRSVAMTIYHTNAFVEERMTNTVATEQRYKAKAYYYILELNDAGDIIGGEWVSTSQRDHPDFIWVALEPMPGDGTPYSANPNLDAKEILKLWAESIGADPNNPPTGLMEPKLATEWGRFPKFDVQINGANTGAAFAVDDAIEILLKRKEGLSGATVEAVLDGNRVPFDQSIAPRASLSKVSDGLHVLEIKWKSGPITVDDQRVRFHVIR
jgi:hypothetical protein